MKATDSSIRKEVAKLADRPHPITLSLLKHGLPISAYLGQQRVATFDGSASIGSVPCEVVKLIDRSNLILKLYIRRSDHLLEAVDSETVDDRGVKVSSQRTKFSYTR